MKKAKKLLCVVIAVCMVLSMVLTLVACNKEADGYTYHTYTAALGNNWNPHTWETNADQTIMEQIGIGFLDSVMEKEGEFGWHYEMATDIKDITGEATAADKTKWNIEEGQEGRMWKITLNPNAKWENGDKITADDYVWSMQQLLDPELQNYRANSYTENDFALVNAAEYRQQGTHWVAAASVMEYADYVPATHDSQLTWKLSGKSGIAEKDKVMSALRAMYDGNSTYGFSTDMTAGAYMMRLDSLTGGAIAGAGLTAEKINALEGKTVAEIKADATLKATYDVLIEWDGEGDGGVFDFAIMQHTSPAVDFANVGLYKTGEYEIVMVFSNSVSDFDFRIQCLGAPWIVHKKTYEDSIEVQSGVKTSKYGTSKETSMAYGPYKIESLQKDKQIVYTQNENWYGWEKERGELGELVSYITLDGKKVRQYQTTKIVIDVMTDEAAKQAFLKGDLDDLNLTADDAPSYATSDRLTKVDETYTMRFFFNTSCVGALDAAGTNTNSIVLSNETFRHAMSLAVNRAELASTATAGDKPAFALLNTLYYYNAAEDPSSIYRTSEWGMKTVVELYDVPYGPGQTYATLEDAYNAVTGYDLTKAKELMKTACEELVAAGKYTAGQEIKIEVGFSKAALDSAAQKHQSLMNKYLNAAAEGSGFGKITLEYKGSIDDRYADTISGKYAIGYGAWGGAAFYPFKCMEMYMEPDTTEIHESGSFNPKTEEMTLEPFEYTDSNGTKQTYPGATKTWERWSNDLKTDFTADINLRLALLSRIEKAYIEKYYCIPLTSNCSVSLTGYKYNNATETYNIMYGFGGLRLMKYNYSDKEWKDFVSQNAKNGVLSYE